MDFDFLKKTLSRFDCDSTFLMTSKGVFSRLKLNTYFDGKIYSEIEPNPSFEQIIHFSKKFNLDNCETIVSIGGGSVIDFSKIICGQKTEIVNKDFIKIKENIEHNNITGDKKINHITIPTLFGSGAEITPFAVCYIQGRKYSLEHAVLKPSQVIRLKGVLNSVPNEIRLANILDCFCQSCESLTSIKKTDESIKNASKSIEILVKASRDYTLNKSIDEKKIMNASMYSGLAISESKTTGPHAMSYFLTSNHHVVHGYSVAWCFLFFIKIYQENSSTECSHLFGILSTLFTTENFYLSIREFFYDLGYDVQSITKLIKEKVNLKEWTNHLNSQRLSNGPTLTRDNQLLLSNLKKYVK